MYENEYKSFLRKEENVTRTIRQIKKQIANDTLKPKHRHTDIK